MFIFAALVVLVLFALAGSGWYVSQHSADELRKMGIEEQ